MDVFSCVPVSASSRHGTGVRPKGRRWRKRPESAATGRRGGGEKEGAGEPERRVGYEAKGERGAKGRRRALGCAVALVGCGCLSAPRRAALVIRAEWEGEHGGTSLGSRAGAREGERGRARASGQSLSGCARRVVRKSGERELKEKKSKKKKIKGKISRFFLSLPFSARNENTARSRNVWFSPPLFTFSPLQVEEATRNPSRGGAFGSAAGVFSTLSRGSHRLAPSREELQSPPPPREGAS